MAKYEPFPGNPEELPILPMANEVAEFMMDNGLSRVAAVMYGDVRADVWMQEKVKLTGALIVTPPDEGYEFGDVISLNPALLDAVSTVYALHRKSHAESD